MLINTLRLNSFRAHKASDVSFGEKVNLIYGPNGAGKTNMLEAIHYLALSKSFLASSDSYVLQKGAPFFEIEGSFSGTHRSAFGVRLVYVPREGKRMFVNKAPLERLAGIVGQIPVVVFSPADQALTAEGPEVRRRFLNNILSQARPVYLDDLMKYRRVLKQRNVLLMQYRRTRALSSEVLSSWDAELVRLGSRVILSRLRFVKAFSVFLDEAYNRIGSVSERPQMRYQTIADFDADADEAAIDQAFTARLQKSTRRALELGRTLVGPHRDEMVFTLNDLEVRRYASQGQHRTFGMALKLAQFFYLKSQVDESPILLLDDLFGNLDSHRTRVFLELLHSDVVGQSLITAAQRAPFDETLSFAHDQNQALEVHEGAVHSVAS